MFEFTQDAAVPAGEATDNHAFGELADLQLALVSGGSGNVLWG